MKKMSIWRELWGVATGEFYREGAPHITITPDFEISDAEKDAALIRSAAGQEPATQREREIRQIYGWE
jgi:hypothetical protein